MSENQETPRIPLDEQGKKEGVLLDDSPSEDEAKTAALDAMHALVADYGDHDSLSLEITRTAPVWCAGHCSTMPAELAPTVEELRQSFGGHKFRIRLKDGKGIILVQKMIMISDVPKNDGEPIRSLNRPPEQEETKGSSEVAAMSGLVRELILQQQQSARQQHQFLERMLFEQLSQRGDAESPVDRIAEMAEMITAMKEILPQSNGEGDGALNSNMMMQLADKMLDRLGERKERQERRPPPKGRVIYRQPPAPLPPPRAENPSPPPATAPDEETPFEPNEETIAAMREARAKSEAREGGVDDSSTPSSVDLDNLAAELEGAAEEDLDALGLILKDVFGGMSPSTQMRLAGIMTGEVVPTLDTKAGERT